MVLVAPYSDRKEEEIKVRTGKCLDCGLDWNDVNHLPDYACWERRAAELTDELNKTFYDPVGHGPDVWCVPTAEAYARVCVLLRKADERIREFESCICTRIPSNDWHLDKCPVRKK